MNPEKEKEKADENNKMIIEEEKKETDKKNINNNMPELCAEKNEKIKIYEQFWVIEKILISPFMVC